MGQLNDTARRPCQVAERCRQGLLYAGPARGKATPAAGIVHGAILPPIEGTIELKRRAARPRNSPRGRVASLRVALCAASGSTPTRWASKRTGTAAADATRVHQWNEAVF